MTMRVYALYFDGQRLLILLLAFILAAIAVGCVRMLLCQTGDD